MLSEQEAQKLSIELSFTIDEFCKELLQEVSEGGNVNEHVKGYFSGLRIAILEKLSKHIEASDGV